MLSKQHGESAVLLDVIPEQPVERCTIVSSLGHGTTAFTGENVGVQRYHAPSGDEREPGQPCPAHAVAEMQGFERAGTDEAVCPADLRRFQLIGFYIIFEYQNSLKTVGQRHLCQRLVRLEAPSHRVVISLDNIKGNWILKQATDGLLEKITPVLPFLYGYAVNSVDIKFDLFQK